LNLRNSVVFDIWNRKQVLEDVSIKDVLEMIGIEYNRLEMYWLIKKLIKIKNVYAKWYQKKADADREKLNAIKAK